MSAHQQLELALRGLRTTRAHLRRAREYARAVGLDERCLARMQTLADEETSLIQLRDALGLAESSRRVDTRKHARSAR